MWIKSGRHAWGSPLAESETAELKPQKTVVEIELVPLPPAATETLAGDALTASQASLWQKRSKKPLCCEEIPPPLALIVNG